MLKQISSLNLASLLSGGVSRATARLGLDLGHRRTKIVVVAREEGRYVLTHAADEQTAAGLFANGRLVDAEEAARQVSRIVAERSIRVRKAALVTTIADSAEVIVKRLDLPRMPREAMLKGLRGNTQLSLSDPNVMNRAVDFHDLGSAQAGVASGHMRLLAVAGHKTAIRMQQGIVQDVGLVPELVSVPSIAVANAFRACMPESVQGGSRTLVIHGGYTGILFLVLDGGVPVATHFAMIGSEHLLERARMANPGASLQALDHALWVEDGHGIPVSVFEEWFNRIAQEARRTAGAAPREGIDIGGTAGLGEVWVTGGIARVHRLTEGLSAQLETQVRVFDPLSHLAQSPLVRDSDVYGPALVVAVGLAVEAAARAESAERVRKKASDAQREESGLIHINLWQPIGHRLAAGARSPIAVAQAAGRDPVIIAALMVALAAVVGGFVLEKRLAAEEVRLQAQSAKADATYKSLGDAIRHAKEMEAVKLRLRGGLDAIRKLDHERYAFVKLMDQVAAKIPPNVWIESLVVDGYNLETGAVEFRLRGYSPSVEMVSAYERGLRESGVVQTTRMTGTESMRVGDIPVVHFELSGRAGAAGGAVPGYAEDGASNSPSKTAS